VQRRRRKSENFKKRLIGLKDAIAELKDKYFELYDINLYIDKALKGVTIIDIRYYSKNSLDIDYREKVSELPPMLHSKVTHPNYSEPGKKFDINWENENWRYKWNTFLLRFRAKASKNLSK
jgi:hypothetical protein